MNLDYLLSEEVYWRHDPTRKAFFLAEISGTKVELRLNNFPDQVLCTLFVGGQSQDVDDWGKKWHLPNEKKPRSDEG
jgi:hypothetical protein